MANCPPEFGIVGIQLDRFAQQRKRVVDVEAADCELGGPAQPAQRTRPQLLDVLLLAAPRELRDLRVDGLGVVVGQGSGARVSA